MATADATASSGAGILEGTDVVLPADVPSETSLVRAIFDGYESGDALEVIDDDRVLYVLPWCARRGGVAGYEQQLGTFDARPVEFTDEEARRLLDEHTARPVDLQETPAWLLDSRGEDEIHVSWHARVRWGERVEAMPDPGPTIRDAFESGVSVGLEDDESARYYAPEDVVMPYSYRGATPVVTTVFEPEDVTDLGADHLTECPNCEELYNPGNQQTCHCCGGPICPWCTETVA